MHTKQLARRIVLTVSPLVLLAGGGCPPTGFLPGGEAFRDLPAEALEQRIVLGGSAERTIIARTAFDDPFANGFPPFDPFDPASIEAFEPDPPQTDVIVVNLNTLESRIVLTGLAVDAFSLITDGQRVAWFDHLDEVVKIVDLDTGAETRLFPGFLRNRVSRVLVIEGPYVVVQAGPSGAFGTALIVVNLETNEQSVIAPALLVNSFGGFGGLPGSVAIDADTLAVHSWPPLTLETDLSDEAALATTIDLVDLGTGQRTTLLPDAGDGGNDSILLAAGRVLLMSTPNEFDAVRVTTTVRGISIDGQTTETLLEFSRDQTLTTSSFIVGFNEWGVLVQVTEFALPPSFRVSDRLEIRTLAGATIVVAESITTDLLGFGPSLPPDPRLIDNYVVYHDPQVFDFVVFDVDAQSLRRFDPFAQ